jgi:ATP-binding cassette subfamily B protein
LAFYPEIGGVVGSLKELTRYLKPYRTAMIIGPLLMCLEVAMDLAQPYLLERIVDVGIAQLDMTIVIRTGLLMLLLSIVGMGGGVGNTLYAVKVTTAFAADLRGALYKKIQTFSFGNLDDFGTGKLVTLLTNDVTQIQNALLILLRIFVRAPLILIGSVIMAFITSPKLAGFMLILMAVLLVTLFFIGRRGQPMFRVVQEKLDQLNTVLQENLAGVRVVKAFVRGQYEKRRFGSANDDLMNESIRVMQIILVIMPVMMLVMNIGLVGVIWFGGIDVIQGQFQVGEIIAFINYLTRSLMSLMMVGQLMIQLSRAQASGQRISEVLQTQPEIQNHENAVHDMIFKGQVVFDQVDFGYDADDRYVLNNISFTAEPGQTVALLGATGSGKSSLVNLIPRYYDVKKGAIRIDNMDVREMDMNTLRQQVGVVLQESVLFSGTIRDNIRNGNSKATDDDVIQAAKAAQAHEFILSFENGYDTVLGQRGVNLSGGQKQRIAIARALIKKPAILILDDSTSAVDVETETKIQAALEGIMANRTSFVIAQRISTVLTADKILVLEQGKIAAEGTHEELLVSSKIYQEIYNSQLGNGVVNHV